MVLSLLMLNQIRCGYLILSCIIGNVLLTSLAWSQMLFIYEQAMTSGGPAKRRVMIWRVIPESYDFGELCSNHAHFSEGQHPIS